MAPQNEIAIFDDHFRPAFDQNAEPVGVIGDQGEEPVQQHEHQPSAKRGKKAALPLIARDRTDARMTMSTASNAVLRASERL